MLFVLMGAKCRVRVRTRGGVGGFKPPAKARRERAHAVRFLRALARSLFLYPSARQSRAQRLRNANEFLSDKKALSRTGG